MNKYNEASPSKSTNIDETIAVIKSKWQIVIALVGTELQIFNTNISYCCQHSNKTKNCKKLRLLSKEKLENHNYLGMICFVIGINEITKIARSFILKSLLKMKILVPNLFPNNH